MPTISMFFGIIVRMYLGNKEHNPPHVHVYYQDASAEVLLADGRLLSGDLPVKQRKLVEAWIELHCEELAADWELAKSGEPPFKIAPLR